jgi:hypothetical protein
LLCVGSHLADVVKALAEAKVVVDAENFGQTTCQAMRMGHSESEIAASAAQFNIQADDARYALHGAEYHFCPSYY